MKSHLKDEVTKLLSLLTGKKNTHRIPTKIYRVAQIKSKPLSRIIIKPY